MLITFVWNTDTQETINPIVLEKKPAGVLCSMSAFQFAESKYIKQLCQIILKICYVG